jgi:hypothetical protein
LADVNDASELESRESTLTLLSQSGVIEMRLESEGLSPTEFDRDRKFLLRRFGVVGVLEAGAFVEGVFNLGV